MRKSEKTALLALLAGLLLLLSACGCWDGAEADLVFVNDADTPVALVGVRYASAAEMARNADNSPICRRDSIGFCDVVYPVTVTVYADLEGRKPLASWTIETPPSGERYYVTAVDGRTGLNLTVSGQWPLDEQGESGQRAVEQRMKAAEKDLGISLSGGTILSFEDTHGGFLGDGETFLTAAFAELPEWLEDWTPLPLTENLARVNSSLAADFFPDIQQGRYFFRDRHADSADPSDDSDLFSRASWNFSLAVYDAERNILYYYKLDT